MKNKIQILSIFLFGAFLNVFAQTNTKLEESNSNNKIQKIVDRAQKAGLDQDRIAKFLDIIEQKEKDLQEIKNSNNDESIYGMLESPMKKTNTEVRMEFAKKLAELVSKEEYFLILEDELSLASDKLAEKEMIKVLKVRELTRDQKKEVYKLIADFYINESTTKAYYVYDKKLKEQKLSALRFYFEKNYRELLTRYGFEMETSVKVNKDTFQY